MCKLNLKTITNARDVLVDSFLTAISHLPFHYQQRATYRNHFIFNTSKVTKDNFQEGVDLSKYQDGHYVFKEQVYVRRVYVTC